MDDRLNWWSDHDQGVINRGMAHVPINGWLGQDHRTVDKSMTGMSMG